MKCSLCRFAKPIDDEPETLHECRRYAPKPVVYDGEFGNDVQTEWGWPMVSHDEWCGEFVANV